MGMRTWLTNLSENGQIRLLNVQLDRLYKRLGITGDTSSEPQEPIKIPTEADMFLAAHPVGEIFHTMNPENPGIRYGGEWVLCAEGRTLVGVDPNNSDYSEAGLTGGSAEANVSAEGFARIGLSGKIMRAHMITGESWNGNWQYTESYTKAGTGTFGVNGGPSVKIPSIKVPTISPYMTCYKWLRLK